ncbi:hypothetical protein E2C01_052684 [Portunus trituberculatus]|uniref:Uncharacterized protein n=1 Tax=Portunus trituberculatus TaxID=210409 RepID=A0A5B7GN56_PORTR|nr:hypothetical protein [Portunus trituberculatus]
MLRLRNEQKRNFNTRLEVLEKTVALLVQ